MTKQNIVNIVSEATGLTKVETEAVMNGVMTTIIESLGRNERVELRGFGTISKKINKEKFVRNPKTNEKIYKDKSFKLHFKIGKILHKKINTLTYSENKNDS